MNKKITVLIFTICFLAAGALSACERAGETTSPTPTKEPTEIPAPAPTAMPDRMGAYLDSIYMFEAIPDQAAKQLLDGTYDIYATGLRADQLSALDGSNITSETSVKRQYELLLNPADTKAVSGAFNPFAYPEIRKALNMLLDRNYITEEIFSGGAVAKYQPIVYASGDYTKSEAAISKLSQELGYEFDSAKASITESLTKNGCTLSDDGIWTYKKSPVEIIVLIRNDDSIRVKIGEYAADQLESIGFLVTRKYVSFSEANSLWAASDPQEGLWHIYTGRRSLDAAPLDQSSAFADYYTSFGANSEIELYKYFKTDEIFTQEAKSLLESSYETQEQRDLLMQSLIEKCNDLSYRIWLVDELAYYPHTEKTEFENTQSARIDTDYATAYTLKKSETYGGSAAWASAALLKEPVNPVNGSVSPSENQYLSFLNLPLTYSDSDAGQIKPVFINKASITYHTSVSFFNNTDWIDTETSEEIPVPNDAAISWSEEKGAPIYADEEYMHDAVGLATAWLATYEREKPKDRDKIARQQEVIEALQAIEDRGYLLCDAKYTIEYDESIFDLKWHDGSPFSIADIIMSFITKTQLMDEKSSLYDEYYAQQHAGELDGFKGYKIVSENPLIIEYYTDNVSFLTSDTVKPFWIDYGTGQQNWALAAAANKTISDKKATYSKGISEYYGYSLLDYVKGSGLNFVTESLKELKSASYIPYSELLLAYIKPEEASSHYQRLLDFYNEYSHLCVGIGPYMITDIDALTPSLALEAVKSFPIKADDLAEKFK